MESWDAVVRQKFLRKSISGLAVMYVVYVSSEGPGSDFWRVDLSNCPGLAGIELIFFLVDG